VTAIVIALLSVAVLAVGMFTFAKHQKGNLTAGSAPAFATGVLALLWAASDTRRGRLVWTG
jgi:hypothetical protein